jgi:hypothetical protein
MAGQICWVCEQRIEPSDKQAVVVSICNLWQCLDGVDQQMSQDIFLCSSCAKERLAGTMDVELEEMSEPWED